MNYTEYTAETLALMNESFAYRYGITGDDVEEVNKFVKLIESTRNIHAPEVGDRVVYTSKHGDYSPGAIINRKFSDNFSVCIRPHDSFISYYDEIWCDVSGGPCTKIPITNLEYKGQCDNLFSIWGHCGMCVGGTVQFNAKVSFWKYSEPEPYYDQFTTENWRKIHIHKNSKDDYNKSGNLYVSDSICFKSEEEYLTFLREYDATVYPGCWPDKYIVWCMHCKKALEKNDDAKSISNDV